MLLQAVRNKWKDQLTLFPGSFLFFKKRKRRDPGNEVVYRGVAMYCGHSFQKWRKDTALVSQLSGKNCTIYSSLFAWWNQNSYRKTTNIAFGATKWRSLTKCVCFFALVELKYFMRCHYQKLLFVELTIFFSSPSNHVSFPFLGIYGLVLYCVTFSFLKMTQPLPVCNSISTCICVMHDLSLLSNLSQREGLCLKQCCFCFSFLII